MSSKIRVLSDHTINKIAAGEVIENPASVVKELVENALDAGSDDICVEIQGGGRQMIRVSDNGCGMNEDDALLCLERHATSKLREVEDIHSLTTMGFRGEAIPSIASISKFNILTCPIQKEGSPSNGTMVMIDGGKLLSCYPAARSQGTTVEVKSLFFNVPVRKKFLKSPTIDANEILKTLSLIALGYPEIRFQLISDGKTLLSVLASKDASLSKQLEERIQNILGSDFLQNSLHIEEKRDEMSLEGFIGLPSNTRHNRMGQYLFINKRAVVSPLVAYAVKEGFGTSIPAGRFPVFVLHLQIDGSLVDVNVHPQKREVRLRQEQQIKELIIKSVRNGMSLGHSPDFSLSQIEGRNSIFAEAFQEATASSSFQDIPAAWELKKKIPSHDFFCKDQPASYFEDKPQEGQFQESPQPPFPFQKTSFELKNIQNEAPSLPLSFVAPKASSLKILATIPGYILLDSSCNHPFIEKGCRHPEKGGIFLVDQKKAQARILFETFLKNQAEPAQQMLLVPYSFELSSFESQILQKAIPSLNRIGIRVQEFGSHTFLVDAIPQSFGNINIDHLISTIIQDFSSHSSEDFSAEKVFQEQSKRMAQAAVRAASSLQGRLSLPEAQSLLSQLLDCRQPHFCPSGKQILAQAPLEELAKFFQR